MIRGKCPKGILEPIYPCDETFAVLEEYLKAIPTDRTIKKDGVVNYNKLQPIIFDIATKTYRLVGPVVGKAFHDGLKLKD